MKGSSSLRLGQYQVMWVFVYFDLPVKTKKERKAYSDFRKGLLMDGFGMIQFSIYARHCASRENAEVHRKRVMKLMPEFGEVILFEITDKQFGSMLFFKNRSNNSSKGPPQQLELF